MWSQILASLDLVVYVKPNSGGPNLVVYVKPNSDGVRFGGLCEAKFGPPLIWWSMWSQIWAALNLVVYVKPNSGSPWFGGLREAKFGPPWIWWSMWSQIRAAQTWWSMWSQIRVASDLVVYVKPNLGRPGFGGLCEAKFGRSWIWWSMWSQIRATPIFGTLSKSIFVVRCLVLFRKCYAIWSCPMLHMLIISCRFVVHFYHVLSIYVWIHSYFNRSVSLCLVIFIQLCHLFHVFNTYYYVFLLHFLVGYLICFTMILIGLFAHVLNRMSADCFDRTFRLAAYIWYSTLLVCWSWVCYISM